MNRSRSLFSLALVLVLAACSGGSKKLQIGGTCTLNTDCKDPLVCKLGACHAGCTQSRDCASGERCVLVDNIGVCQQAAEAPCAASAPRCKTPLVCAADNLCRNSCTVLADCMRGQECVASVCLESTEATTWRADGGAGSDAGGAATPDGRTPTTDARILQPDAAGAASDVPASTNQDTSPAGIDAPMGSADGNRTGADGGSIAGDGSSLTPPDLQPTKWDTGLSIPVATATAVADPTSARPGEEITVKVSGVGLTSPDKFTLGGVAVTKAQVSDATDVAFTAKLSVPHGITPAIVDLGFTTAGGQVLAPSVLQVTPITVSLTGLDTNRGTSDSPFRTVTKALQTAGVGDSISVGEGTFKDGETWPALPDKLTLQGAGASKTSFVGTGNLSVAFAGDATVKTLALSNFVSVKIDKPRTTVNLENMRFPEDTSNGLIVLQASATSSTLNVSGKETVLGRGDATSVLFNLAAPYSTLTLKDGTYLGGHNAVATASIIEINTSKATIRIAQSTLGDELTSKAVSVLSDQVSSDVTVEIDGATINGSLVLGLREISPPSLLPVLTVTNSNFAFKGGYDGITFGGKSATLTGNTFTGGKDQVVLRAGAQLTARSCNFSTYERYGINVASGANLDLGSASAVGGNTFTGSKASGIYGLYDGRTAVSTTSIPVSGTSFNGVTPPAGVITKSTVLAACEPGAYCISTNGNSITFY
jgi:hypothetical protein